MIQAGVLCYAASTNGFWRKFLNVLQCASIVYTLNPPCMNMQGFHVNWNFFILVVLYFVFRSTGETAVSAFEIDKMYTPLFFARVRSYTAFSERPL